MGNWIYLLLGFVVWPFIKLAASEINRAVVNRRMKRFLKLVTIEFPDRSKITFKALDTSDKRAMAKLERELSTNSSCAACGATIQPRSETP